MNVAIAILGLIAYVFICLWFGLGVRFAEGSLIGFFAGCVVHAIKKGRDVSRCERCAEEDLRREKALTEALEVVGDFPDDPEGHHNLGWLYEKDGLLEQALAEYRRADELANGDDPEPDIPDFRADYERISQRLSSQKSS
jgi:tetratricopeptide (TPR) repeat protein